MSAFIAIQKLFPPRLVVVTITVTICLLIIYRFLSEKPENSGNNKAIKSNANLHAQALVMQADDLLHTRLLELQQLDRAYASTLHEASSAVALEVGYVSIQRAEALLKRTIDSIENSRERLDKKTSSDLWKLTAYFQTIIENRQFLTSINAAAQQNEGATSNEKLYLIALEEELKQKEAFITKLKTQSSMVTHNQSKPAQHQLSSQKIRSVEAIGEMVYKPAPGETIEELKQRNINLKLAFNNTATELGVLSKKYSLLIKDYERLSNQLKASRKD